MQFVLTGFTQETAFRVFAFERIGSDRLRTKMVVRANLALSRRYGIPMQELPLLCRNLLERNENGTETHTFTFSENDMCLYAKDRALAKEAAAQRRKPPRRTPSDNVGAAWRGHNPLQAERMAAGTGSPAKTSV